MKVWLLFFIAFVLCLYEQPIFGGEQPFSVANGRIYARKGKKVKSGAKPCFQASGIPVSMPLVGDKLLHLPNKSLKSRNSAHFGAKQLCGNL